LEGDPGSPSIKLIDDVVDSPYLLEIATAIRLGDAKMEPLVAKFVFTNVKQGITKFTVENGLALDTSQFFAVNRSSIVVGSISEVVSTPEPDAISFPSIGKANLQLWNIAPRDPGVVEVTVNMTGWDKPITVQICLVLLGVIVGFPVIVDLP
jgi:hypothetical protein